MEPTPGVGKQAAPDRAESDVRGPGAASAEQSTWKAGFNEILLGGVVLLTAILLVLGIGFYLAPGDYLQLPELQPAVRVAKEGSIPVGGSRVVSWGSRVILVVRTAEREYAALQADSPLDGCILDWDAASMRVVSPCRFVVYDLHGNVVRGLTTVPLLRYSVFVRNGAIYATGTGP